MVVIIISVCVPASILLLFAGKSHGGPGNGTKLDTMPLKQVCQAVIVGCRAGWPGAALRWRLTDVVSVLSSLTLVEPYLGINAVISAVCALVSSYLMSGSANAEGTSKPLRPNRRSIRYGKLYKERVILCACWHVAKDILLAVFVIAIRLDCQIPCYAFPTCALRIDVSR